MIFAHYSVVELLVFLEVALFDAQSNSKQNNLLTRALQLKFRRKIIMERIKLIKALVPKSAAVNTYESCLLIIRSNRNRMGLGS